MKRRLDCAITLNKPTEAAMALIDDIKNRLYANKGKNLSNCEMEVYELKAQYSSIVIKEKFEAKNLFSFDVDDIMRAVSESNLTVQVVFTWHDVVD